MFSNFGHYVAMLANNSGWIIFWLYYSGIDKYECICRAYNKTIIQFYSYELTFSYVNTEKQTNVAESNNTRPDELMNGECVYFGNFLLFVCFPSKLVHTSPFIPSADFCSNECVVLCNALRPTHHVGGFVI